MLILFILFSMVNVFIFNFGVFKREKQVSHPHYFLLLFPLELWAWNIFSTIHGIKQSVGEPILYYVLLYASMEIIETCAAPSGNKLKCLYLSVIWCRELINIFVSFADLSLWSCQKFVKMYNAQYVQVLFACFSFSLNFCGQAYWLHVFFFQLDLVVRLHGCLEYRSSKRARELYCHMFDLMH